MVRKDIKLPALMVTVSFCLLPVIASGHRFAALESSLTIGVLSPTRVMTTALSACSSIVLTAMSIGAAATTGGVYGLSQNNKCSFTSIRVYANGAKTERIKILK